MIVTSYYTLVMLLLILQIICSEDIITTIAGTGTADYTGDNVQATSAALNWFYGLTLDSSGRTTILILAFFY